MKKHSSLIWISTDLMAGSTRLKELIQQISEIGAIQQVSSIYKKYLNQRSEDLNSNLVLVLRIGTDHSMEEVFALLQGLEQSKEAQFGANTEGLALLAFDQEVRMMPGQNLPNPKLHVDPLTLRCAAEAWGDYHHPVLGQTLQELVRFSDPLRHVEFFAQGRSLFSTEPT